MSGRVTRPPADARSGRHAVVRATPNSRGGSRETSECVRASDDGGLGEFGELENAHAASGAQRQGVEAPDHPTCAYGARRADSGQSKPGSPDFASAPGPWKCRWYAG